MADNKLPFALSFERQYAGPLDPTTVFETYADMQAYLTNETRYAGQIAFCNEDGTLHYLANRDSWLPVNDQSIYDAIDSVNARLDMTMTAEQIMQLESNMIEQMNFISDSLNAHTHTIEQISGLANVLQSLSQNINEVEYGTGVVVAEAVGDIAGNERILTLNAAGNYAELTPNEIKAWIKQDQGIIMWEDSGENAALGASWTIKGTIIGNKYDVIIRMHQERVYTQWDVNEQINIYPLAQFTGLAHNKFLEAIVSEIDGGAYLGNGGMGLIVYNFYSQNQHAFPNQMSQCNELNESAYISNYNDTSSSSYYYDSNKLPIADTIMFYFANDYFGSQNESITVEYHLSGVGLNLSLKPQIA